MRRYAPVLSLLLLVGAASVAVAARDPHAEKLRLNRHDMALARRLTLNRFDLTPGWRRRPSSRPSDGPSGCPGYRPDFSRFTITGEGSSSFAQAQRSFVDSAVEIYPNRAQAAGDFRAGTKPRSLLCIRWAVLKGLPDVAHARILSARIVTPPSIGELSARCRVVVRVTVRGRRVNMYADFIAFERGRAQGVLSVLGVRRHVGHVMSYGREFEIKARGA